MTATGPLRWLTSTTGRRAALFVVGLAGVAYETVTRTGETDNTLLLCAFGAMMGLPVMARVITSARGDDRPPPRREH